MICKRWDTPKNLPSVSKTERDSDPKKDTDNNQIVEETANEELVQSTLIEIQDLYRKHHTDYLIAVGELIADNFFDSDGERMRAKKPVLLKSFNMLCEELKKADTQLPKRTWLYSAVNVYVDSAYLLKNYENDLFQTYEKLLPSKKVEIARIREDWELVEFLKSEDAKEIDKLSVRELREKVADFLGTKPKKKTTIGLSQKTKSISKQVQKWQDQIAASMKEGTPDQKKKFKELNTLLNNVVKELDKLGKLNG